MKSRHPSLCSCAPGSEWLSQSHHPSSTTVCCLDWRYLKFNGFLTCNSGPLYIESWAALITILLYFKHGGAGGEGGGRIMLHLWTFKPKNLTPVCILHFTLWESLACFDIWTKHWDFPPTWRLSIYIFIINICMLCTSMYVGTNHIFEK